MNWRDGLDTRMRGEVALAEHYAANPHSGSGHYLSYLTIARLARELDIAYGLKPPPAPPPTEAELAQQEIERMFLGRQPQPTDG